MKTKLYLLLMLLTVSLSNELKAQQDAQFTQYMFNQLYFNPAYVGIESSPKFSFIHRTQYLGYESSLDGSGNPQTQLLSFSTPILNNTSGLGLHVVNDNIGALNNLQAILSYAYHLKLGTGKLSLGSRVGSYSQFMNYDKLRAEDKDNDNLLNKIGTESQTLPDIGVGVWYQSSKYFAGFSANNLLESSFDFNTLKGNSKLTKHYYLTGGYNFSLNESLTLTPSFLLKSLVDPWEPTSYELSAIANYENKFWGGVNYRQQDAIGAIIGLGLLKDNSLKVGLGFDFVSPGTNAKSTTSGEIMLTYSLPALAVGPKPLIRTPRYRKE